MLADNKTVILVLGGKAVRFFNQLCGIIAEVKVVVSAAEFPLDAFLGNKG